MRPPGRNPRRPRFGMINWRSLRGRIHEKLAPLDGLKQPHGVKPVLRLPRRATGDDGRQQGCARSRARARNSMTSGASSHLAEDRPHEAPSSRRPHSWSMGNFGHGNMRGNTRPDWTRISKRRGFNSNERRQSFCLLRGIDRHPAGGNAVRRQPRTLRRHKCVRC